MKRSPLSFDFTLFALLALIVYLLMMWMFNELVTSVESLEQSYTEKVDPYAE